MEFKAKASFISGISEVFITYPIDYVKNIRQSNNSITLLFNNPFRGVSARLIGVVPMRMFFWNSFHYAHTHNYSHFQTAALVSSVETILSYPIEQITVQKMIYNSPYSKCFNKSTLLPGFTTALLRNFGFAYIVNSWISEKDSTFIDSAIGGMLAASLTQPLDTLKTHYHTTNSYKLPSYTLRRWYTGTTHRSLNCLLSMSVGWAVFSYF